MRRNGVVDLLLVLKLRTVLSRSAATFCSRKVHPALPWVCFLQVINPPVVRIRTSCNAIGTSKRNPIRVQLRVLVTQVVVDVCLGHLQEYLSSPIRYRRDIRLPSTVPKKLWSFAILINTQVIVQTELQFAGVQGHLYCPCR